MTFGSRLARATKQYGPLCVGVDPSPALLDAWGLPVDAEGLDRVGSIVIDAMPGSLESSSRRSPSGRPTVPLAIAPWNSSLRAPASEFLVVADAKRGDIGSTSAAYARAWLDPASPLCVDAVTVTAYLGLAALGPLLQHAQRHDNGVIVVARSSNTEGAVVQSAVIQDGSDIADHLLRLIAQENAAHAPHGNVGAVVGGTTATGGFDISRLGGPVLAPGFGAQGATAADYPRLYGTSPAGTVMASVSRGILQAGPNPERLASAATTWQRDLLAAALV